MKIATAPSRSSKRWRTTEVSWDWLLDRLRTPKRTGETMAEYRRMTKEEQSHRKDVGGFVGGAIEGGRRVSGAVRERWLLTLDADDAKADDWEEVTSLYDWRMCVYSTHSHTPEHPRLRWIIPVRRAMSPEEYQACARKMAELIGMDTMDPTTFQPERLMYWPSCSEDAEYVFHEQDGPILNPDELLRLYGSGEAWKDVSLWPLGQREQEVVVREAKRQGDPTEKNNIVGRFCRVYDVPAAIDRWLSDVYEPCEASPGRFTYVKGSSSGGAVLYDHDKFLYSHHATDPAGGQLLNAFDLVRIHLFGEQDNGHEQVSIEKRPSYKAMSAMVSEDPEFIKAQAAERIASINADFADLEESPDCETGQESPEHEPSTKSAEKAARKGVKSAEKGADDQVDLSWTEELEYNRKTGEMDPTIQNAVLILGHDPKLAGKVALNEFSGRPTLRGPVPWRPGAKDGDLWKDSDEASLRLYMEKYWKFKGKDKINDAIAIVLEQNAYHPVREYLQSLEWDGVERLDTMLVRYMAAEDNKYVHAVTRKWMCGAVKRVFEPGCKFDSMLVLVGGQGIGKSRLGYILSRGWFTDSLTRMDGKEAYEAIRGAWIVELSELAAARKSEIEAQKQFVSAQVDNYRPAYGKNVAEFKRQCVFYATTNDTEPLRDNTGARRYWPVQCPGVNEGQHIGLEEEVDQLWAEAVVRYRAGESLWLDDAGLAGYAQVMQEAYSERDEWFGLIQEYLDIPITPDWESKTPEERRAWIRGDSLETWDELDLVQRETVSSTEIRVECFGEDRAGVRGNDQTGRRISKIMGQMPGWKKQKTLRRVAGYGPQRWYAREK
jgi:predicted P-loop ATPase